MPALRFGKEKKNILKPKLIEKDDVTIICDFPAPVFSGHFQLKSKFKRTNDCGVGWKAFDTISE